MPLSMLKKMLYTFLLERTAFPLDLDRLEMEGPWIQTWTKVGKVLAVLDWVEEVVYNRDTYTGEKPAETIIDRVVKGSEPDMVSEEGIMGKEMDGDYRGQRNMEKLWTWYYGESGSLRGSMVLRRSKNYLL